MRIGQGFDIHSFGGNNPLIIGGVHIPYQKGLLAHSDGDVLLHALADSLLGAAGLGDIGRLFPDTDNTYRGINSRCLLRQIMTKIIKNSYYVGNVDLTIIAQEPIMLPYIQKMRINIAEDLSINLTNINVKAKTSEGLGCIGRQEGIACQAVSLLFLC
ncbi:2-C-methyl-D-erythritol 2,4-cyclodiphosphate synthase [Candidatus Erwinia haradaeae]|uniref:2-C-methyl-D-erythritol 2,4-cyclodiphosphate synthase n=1 Tax=Candidatus Erwinia haradaeae TaxID=1922217 RepID=A0A451D006_9GAMM|nr:2-C-methyl-D-erythritol 2,4-cyclodiphosphate synthase [Candidatus Erwinia haradaeae]VFP78954.1 2-C-methyl-D-erythritol 2,4-cyclodiphosphate synthase [Candidatus Erwinia haradaeae]